MGDLVFHPGDLVSMLDADGNKKYGIFIRRCMESKKKKSTVAGNEESPAGAEGGDAIPIDAPEFEEHPFSPSSQLTESPFVMVKWNPCGAETSQFSYWNSMVSCGSHPYASAVDESFSKVAISDLTLVDRCFSSGDRVSKYRKGKPPIQGHVIGMDIFCDCKILNPSSSANVHLDKVHLEDLQPMAPYLKRNRIMSYYNKKTKSVHLGIIEKCKFDIEVEFPDGAVALVPSNMPALLLDFNTMQFSALKSHSSGNILHIGQQLLISVSNLKQIKKWVKPGPDFCPPSDDATSVLSTNTNVNDKVVATIVRLVPTKIFPIWIYPTNHVCGQDIPPYTFSVSSMKQFDETCWSWAGRQIGAGRSRSLFRKKFLYKLKEEDIKTIHKTTSDSKHSSFFLNGNNNNQGLTFNPCSCMSVLGLPPQNVSVSSFSKIGPDVLRPETMKSGDLIPVEVVKTQSFATVLWQDGVVEKQCSCINLLPGKYGMVMRDFFPGNLVIEKHSTDSSNAYGSMPLSVEELQKSVLKVADAMASSVTMLNLDAPAPSLDSWASSPLGGGPFGKPMLGHFARNRTNDLSSYGVVLKSDQKNRTAVIKWVQVKSLKIPRGDRQATATGAGPSNAIASTCATGTQTSFSIKKEVIESKPEEMSIYDLCHHPSTVAKFSIGHIVSKEIEKSAGLDHSKNPVLENGMEDKENCEGAIGDNLGKLGSKQLGMIMRFDPQDGKFEIKWLNGSITKSLPHEMVSTMRDLDFQYDEEDDYWVEEADAVPYDYYNDETTYSSEGKVDEDDWMEASSQEAGVGASKAASEDAVMDYEEALAVEGNIQDYLGSTLPNTFETSKNNAIFDTFPAEIPVVSPPLPPKQGHDAPLDDQMNMGFKNLPSPIPCPMLPSHDSVAESLSSTETPTGIPTSSVPDAPVPYVPANSNLITQVSLAQVMTTVGKLKTVMNDVVNVIGDLEVVLKTANAAANTQPHGAAVAAAAAVFPTVLCSNCSQPTAVAPNASFPVVETKPMISYNDIMNALEEKGASSTPDVRDNANGVPEKGRENSAPNGDKALKSVYCPQGHELVSYSVDNGWVCDGKNDPRGCGRGINSFFQTTGIARFRCGTCDYDLCDACYYMRSGASGKVTEIINPLKDLLPTKPDEDLLPVEGYRMEDHIHNEHHFYLCNNSKSKPSAAVSAGQSKTIVAIQKELFKLKFNLPKGIWVRSFEDRLDMASFAIKGPTGTPYEDGLFLFDVFFRDNYPKNPPSVHYISCCKGKLNPNLYEDGMVCLSLLGTWDGKKEETWNEKTSTFLQVLVSIQGLVLNAEPYYNEPGFERDRGNAIGNEKCQQYNEVVLMKLLEHMSKLLQRPAKIWHGLIVNHFRQHGWRLYHRVMNMMAISAEITEASEETSDENAETSPSLSTVSNHLINFPLLPLTRGGCISLKRSLDAYKKALIAAGIVENLSVYDPKDIALPEVDKTRI